MEQVDFSFSDTNIILNEHRITGFGDSPVNWKPDKAFFVKYVSPNGNVAVAGTNCKSGVLTLNLIVGHPDNVFMSKLLANKMANKKLVFPLNMSNPLGTTKIITTQAWPTGYTELNWDENITFNSWIIDHGVCDTLII